MKVEEDELFGNGRPIYLRGDELATGNGKAVVHGVALGADDITLGSSKKRKRWTEDALRESAESLEGVPVVKNHTNDDIDQILGKVDSARYKEGVGVLYQASVSDDDAAGRIRRGEVEVSPRVRHSPTDELDQEDDGTYVVGSGDIQQFDNLSVVTHGAAPSNMIDTGPSPDISAAEMAMAFDEDPTELEDEGDVDVDEVGEVDDDFGEQGDVEVPEDDDEDPEDEESDESKDSDEVDEASEDLFAFDSGEIEELDWTPSLHPRGPLGRFIEIGGSAAGSAKDAADGTMNRASDKARKKAKTFKQEFSELSPSESAQLYVTAHQLSDKTVGAFASGFAEGVVKGVGGGPTTQAVAGSIARVGTNLSVADNFLKAVAKVTGQDFEDLEPGMKNLVSAWMVNFILGPKNSLALKGGIKSVKGLARSPDAEEASQSNGDVEIAELVGVTTEPPEPAQQKARTVLKWSEEHEDTASSVGDWSLTQSIADGDDLSPSQLSKMATAADIRNQRAVSLDNRNEPWTDGGHVAYLGSGGAEGVEWAWATLDSAYEPADFGEIDEIEEDGTAELQFVESVDEALNGASADATDDGGNVGGVEFTTEI